MTSNNDDKIGLIQQTDGPTMTTFSGREVCIFNFQPGDINIIDIAHALSMQCRYAGHCREFYSVAEHSVYVSFETPSEDAFEGLMHDSPEAYVQDMIRPIKVSALGDLFRQYEDNVAQSISKEFNLRYPWVPSIKHADNVVLFAEKRDVVVRNQIPWHGEGNYTPMARKIECWPPKLAEKVFLERFYELNKIRNHS